MNCGAVLHSMGHFENALVAYREAVAREPHNAEAHWNKSLLLLLLGDYLEGWALYEWRLKSDDAPEQVPVVL